MRAALLVALALLASARPARAASVCSANDVVSLCGGGSCTWSCAGNACTLTGTATVTPPTPGAVCTFDFGTQDVTLKNGGFTGGSNAFEIRARSLTVNGKGVLTAAGGVGAPGGMITLTLGAGGFTVVGSPKLIDLTGKEPGGGGHLVVQSAGAVSIGGSTGISADGTSAGAPGGVVQISATGDVTVTSAVTAMTDRASTASGGTVTLTATGTIDVENTVDVTGGAGGGGLINLTAGGDAILGDPPHADPLLVADGVLGDAGSGGTIQVQAGGMIGGTGGVTTQISAIGNIPFTTGDAGGLGGTVALTALNGPITLGGGSAGGVFADGSTDSCGGSIFLVSAGPPGAALTIGVPLSATAPIDSAGNGGTICIGGLGAVAIAQPVTVAGGGGGGGDITVNVQTAATVSGAGALHADGTGGAGSVSIGAGSATIAGPMTAANLPSVTDDGPGGQITLQTDGALTLSALIDGSATAANDGGCVDVEAGLDLTLAPAAVVRANGGLANGAGGDVLLLAGGIDLPGDLTLDGTVQARGSMPGAQSAALATLQGCTVHVGMTGMVDTTGDALASNVIVARKGLVIDGAGTHVLTTGVDPASRNTVYLPTGAPGPGAALFSPPLAPTDLIVQPPCTANQQQGCQTPCPQCGDQIVEFPETCDAGGANGPCQPCGPTCRVTSCDDANPCTTDGCDPILGCVHTAVPDGTACDDHDACTTVDACRNGFCAGTQPLACDDGDPCTADLCLPATGCAHTVICTTTTTSSTSTSTASTSTSTSSTLDTSSSTTTSTSTSTVTTTSSTTSTSTTSSTSTSTTTTSTSTTSSTTTVPPECVPGTAGACDDGDRCTVDACAADGRCRHDAASGYDAVTCRLDTIDAMLRGTPATALGGGAAQGGLERRIAQARGTLASARVGGRRAAKRLKQTSKRIAGFIRAVHVGEGRRKIDRVIGDRLLALASGAASELRPLRPSLR